MDALSQAIPTILFKGISLFLKQFSKAEYNFFAEQSVASNCNNSNNSITHFLLNINKYLQGQRSSKKVLLKLK